MRLPGLTLAAFLLATCCANNAMAQWQSSETLDAGDLQIRGRGVDFYALFFDRPVPFEVRVRADFPQPVVALISPSNRIYLDDTGASTLRVQAGEIGEWRLAISSRVQRAFGQYKLVINGSLGGSPGPKYSSEHGTQLLSGYFRSLDRGNKSWTIPAPSLPPPAPSLPPPAPSWPPPSPPPPPLLTPQPSIDAYWNEWIEELGDQDREPVEALEKGGDYRLLIDLAAVRYGDLLEDPDSVDTTIADAELRAAIEERLKANKTNLRVLLHVVALGPNLRIDKAPKALLDLDLTRVDNPPPPPGKPSVPSDLTPVFSAGTISTEVHALAPGCGAVVIFITAGDGVRPLDHLVQRVEIVDSGGVPKGNCFSGKPSFESGLKQLLALAGGPPADVGLQIVETDVGPETRSAVLLVDKNGRHWSWEMASSLAAYLGDKQLLEKSIDSVRSKLTSNKPLDYSAAGLELSKVIFSGKRIEESAKADDALKALKTRVDGGPTPSVLIRAVDKEKNELFVPLRLITAKGDKAQFKGTLHVVHPLPHGESYRDERPPCVEDWAFAIPVDLGGSQLPKGIRNDSSWLHSVDTTIDALRKFFGRKPQQKPEGLVLLSHHSTGALWYEENGERLMLGDLKHTFADGSVGVLLSCDVAAAREQEMVLTRRLSLYGVDSVILSPFSLKATYGRAFSIGFAEAVQEARAAGQSATLLELFDQAAAKAVVRLKAEKARDYSGMDLELIVAGDHSQTLCAKETQ